jgi:hypothetical protein
LRLGRRKNLDDRLFIAVGLAQDLIGEEDGQAGRQDSQRHAQDAIDNAAFQIFFH